MSQHARVFLNIGIAVFISAAANAQVDKDPHAVQPERPTVATHAGTVAPGWLEIETGVERDRFDAAVTSWFTPTVLKVGLAHNAQLSIGGALQHTASTTGLGDAFIGIKWRLVDDAPVVGDFAVLPAVKFPTGSRDDGTGTGTTDVSLLLISSHSFGPVAMDLNAGYTRRGGDNMTTPQNATIWTASFGGPFGGSLGWVAECYGYPGTSGPAGQPPLVAVLAGPTVALHSWLALDVGVIVPVSGPQPHALYAGGVYNVGHLPGIR